MAEELHGSLSSFNTWTSLRCNDLFSCSAAVNAGENGGGFGCFPTTTDIFELSDEANYFNCPHFASLDLLPSSVDWPQSFQESSETNNSHASLLEERRSAEQYKPQIGFTETPQDSVRDMANQGFFLWGDQNLTGFAVDDNYIHSPFDFPCNSSLFWNTAAKRGGLSSSFTTTINPTEKSKTTSIRDPVLPTAKKLRIDTPSSLPTFKIRKEKLGDRITALQQLVSPFGKTDTASVLHEAIDYIKFLHDQVSGLSNSHVRNGHQSTNQQNALERQKKEESAKKDLRSRGLCLVPFSSTFEVASNEIQPLDFWTQLWRKL